LNLNYSIFFKVKRGQKEELKRLLATGLACPNAIFNGWTLLGCAVSTQNIACVKLLLDAGADARYRISDERLVSSLQMRIG